jgi:hypothetical protein
MLYRSRSVALFMCVFVLATVGQTARAEEIRFRDRCLDNIVRAVPGILKSQEAKTGRFGTGIWLVTDQNVMFPLAAAWATKDPRNPYYHSDELLAAIMAAGDALIADQDETGQWEFRKKDGSTWGRIYMPWTYSRWIRSYALIRDAMPPERREKWVKALRLGFAGIVRGQLGHVHNIPSHLAMALYFAGGCLDEPAWMKQAGAFMHKVVAAQHPDGYWSEHSGPVINYDFVYVDAVGTYYAASGDDAVLGDEAFAWAAGTLGAWIEHGGVRLSVPKIADVRWPVVPHNPYRKDGRAEPSEGRIVIDLPFGSDGGEQSVGISVQ